MAAPSLSKTKPTEPKKPSKATFARYLEVRDKRLELGRQASSLEREEKALAADILAYAAHAGGPTRTVECCGHRASITSAPGYVSWVKEFERAVGFAEAEQIRKDCPPVDRLKVEKL